MNKQRFSGGASTKDEDGPSSWDPGSKLSEPSAEKRIGEDMGRSRHA